MDLRDRFDKILPMWELGGVRRMTLDAVFGIQSLASQLRHGWHYVGDGHLGFPASVVVMINFEKAEHDQIWPVFKSIRLTKRHNVPSSCTLIGAGLDGWHRVVAVVDWSYEDKEKLGKLTTDQWRKMIEGMTLLHSFERRALEVVRNYVTIFHPH